MAKKRKRKYSPGAGTEVKREMHRYKRGKAKSGKGGRGGKVKSRIALSKARRGFWNIPELNPLRARCPRAQTKENPMGLFSKDIATMDDLFVHTLRDMYYAENQIVKALPDMIEKATDAKLKEGFQTHLGETKNQIKRLEQVFKLQGVEAMGVDCPAIDGIIEEADEVAGEVDDKNVLDAALIAAAQAVEHYEMTRYGTLIAWAKQLGRADCARLLEQNLQEEKAADSKLTALAESNINRKAA
jgi:ferritin-like metal-binding protein YciE